MRASRRPSRRSRTRRTSPKDCWATRNSNVEFQDYYKNLTIHDVAEVLDLDSIFERWVAYYHKKHKDLFFLGIKNGSPEPVPELPRYVDKHTSLVGEGPQ